MKLVLPSPWLSVFFLFFLILVATSVFCSPKKEKKKTAADLQMKKNQEIEQNKTDSLKFCSQMDIRYTGRNVNDETIG